VAFSNHSYHASHHNLTSKKPRSGTSFSQKPLQKRVFTTRRKKHANISFFGILLPMETPTPPPEKRPAFSSPLMFFIIAGIIIASITLFLIFRPNPSGTTPQTTTPATQQ
jgi:hypothetical protein